VVLSHRALKAAIKYAVAAAVAGSIAVATDRVMFIWYPLLAVVMCMDETETQVVAAARGRCLGTIAGGLVGFLIHPLLQGWIALTVGLLLVLPLLRRFGWQAGMATAVVLLSMLFLVVEYSDLNWIYVFNRTIDTLIGVVVALLVTNLLWPVNRLAEIQGLDQQLREAIARRLLSIQQQLSSVSPALGPAKGPAPALEGTRLWRQLNQLVNDELRNHPQGLARRQHWRQRSLLWERINHHSMQLQRLCQLIPAGSLPPPWTGPNAWLESLPALVAPNGNPAAQVPLPARQQLAPLAEQRGLPPLLLYALEDELRRLVCSAQSLALAGRPGPTGP
jgi:uncharacterized membrane protein YccC